jgi:hypothetical protein
MTDRTFLVLVIAACVVVVLGMVFLLNAGSIRRQREQSERDANFAAACRDAGGRLVPRRAVSTFGEVVEFKDCER